jgi:pimeloyl-ACP methyl ester carboxylesterase
MTKPEREPRAGGEKADPAGASHHATRSRWIWLGAGVGGVTLAAALPALLAWGFLHPPRRTHRRNPRTALGLPYERVRLRTRDGLRLSGWYVPVRAGATPRGVVVVCHGYFGNRGTMLPHVEFLHDAGYAVLLFDWRAHGWSDGTMATFGHTEPEDLRAALDWARARPELDGLPLALYGESMGASVALLVAADEAADVQAVIADSAYARFDSAVASRIRLAFGPAMAPLLTPPTQRIGEAILGARAEEIAPMDAMRRIYPRPVLLIHGTEDRLVTPENARRLLAASPGNATLWEVPGSGHVQGIHVAGAEYARRVTAFLDGALQTPEVSGSPRGASPPGR